MPDGLDRILEVHIKLVGDQYSAFVAEDTKRSLMGFGNTPMKALRELVDEIGLHGWGIGPWIFSD